MLAFLPLFVEVKKNISSFYWRSLQLPDWVLMPPWSSNGLPRIDNKTLARLAQQHPVVVLFRHAERCDRSTNQCLSDKTGITVKGTRGCP